MKTTPAPRLFKTTADIKNRAPDRRRKRTLMAADVIPAGSVFVLSEHRADTYGDLTLRTYSISFDGDLSLTWRTHGDGKPTKLPTDAEGNEALGWTVMENAEEIRDTYRATYMRAVGEDPNSRFSHLEHYMAQKLFDMGFVSEKALAQAREALERDWEEAEEPATPDAETEGAPKPQ